jgi:hypothetical protein
MIGQYLSNKNESATVAKSEIFSELNKAQLYFAPEEKATSHPLQSIDVLAHGHGLRLPTSSARPALPTSIET